MYAAQAIPEAQTIEKLVDAATTDLNTGLVLILVLFAATAFIFIWSNRSHENKITDLVAKAMDNKSALGDINERVAAVAEAQRSIVTAVNDQLKPLSELADAWVNTLERTQTAQTDALTALLEFINGVKTIALENKQLIVDNSNQHTESLEALHGKVDAMGTTEDQILKELKEMNINLKALVIANANMVEESRKTMAAIQTVVERIATRSTSEVEAVKPEDAAPDATA